MQRKIWIVLLCLGVASAAAAWSAFMDLQSGDSVMVDSSIGKSGFKGAVLSRPSITQVKAAPGPGQPAYELREPIKNSTLHEPVALAVGDVTGDGRDDVAVLTRYFPNGAEAYVVIYEQVSSGGLTRWKTYQVGGPNTWTGGIRMGDMNNDAVMDIVVTHSKGLTLLTANPAGGEFVIQNFESNGFSDDLGVLDVDRDGYLDVVTQSSSATTTVLYGDGTGGVRSSMPLPGTSNVSDLEVGDVTGDGLPDVVTSTRQPGGFEVRPLNAAGGFAPLRSYPSSDIWSTDGVAIGDFNADGLNDVAVPRAKNSPTEVWMHYQDAEGSLGPAVSLPSYDIPSDTFAADLDRDGRTELIVSHIGWGRIGYYLQGSEGLAPEVLLPAFGNPSGSNTMSAGDINNDGCGDLLYLETTALALRYGSNCHVAPAPRVADDVDGDGKTDMLWRHETKMYFAYWLMEGAERRDGQGYAVGPDWDIIAKGDFNGDGAFDLVWSDGHSMQLWQRDGDGYQGLGMPSYPQGYRVVATGDVNGDGKTDLLWRDGANTVLALWVMDGASVSDSHAYGFSPEWRVAGAGDLNGDRRLDLVVTNGTRMELWRGARNLLWDPASMVGYPVGWELTGAADIDGDGRDDLLWRHAQQAYFVYWRMWGPRRLNSREYRVDWTWRVLDSGDYNGDGKADIVWTNGAHMQLWASRTIEGFVGLEMPSYPQGWTPQ